MRIRIRIKCLPLLHVCRTLILAVRLMRLIIVKRLPLLRPVLRRIDIMCEILHVCVYASLSVA